MGAQEARVSEYAGAREVAATAMKAGAPNPTKDGIGVGMRSRRRITQLEDN